MKHRPNIKKAVFGPDPTSGYVVVCGQSIGNNTVTAILENTQHFILYGIVEYLVFLQPKDESRDEFIWLSFKGVPASLTYFYPGEGLEEINVT